MGSRGAKERTSGASYWLVRRYHPHRSQCRTSSAVGRMRPTRPATRWGRGFFFISLIHSSQVGWPPKPGSIGGITHQCTRGMDTFCSPGRAVAAPPAAGRAREARLPHPVDADGEVLPNLAFSKSLQPPVGLWSLWLGLPPPHPRRMTIPTRIALRTTTAAH